MRKLGLTQLEDEEDYESFYTKKEEEEPINREPEERTQEQEMVDLENMKEDYFYGDDVKFK